MRRIAAILAVVALVLLGPASIASAAPTPNDRSGGGDPNGIEIG